MAFGLLKHFKDRRADSSETKTTRHMKHVIVGQDLAAVLKLVQIRRQFPEEMVRLISPRALSRQLLIENYEFGVSQMRSPVAVENIYRKHFNAKFYPQSKDATFYKDGKFHEFGSRARPMNLLTGEEFFVEKGYKTSIASFFDEESWNNLDAILTEFVELRILEAVEKTNATDLVEKNEWLLSFKDFSEITTENLYLSSSPKRFLNFLQRKEELSKELIDVCTSIKSQAAISVSWILNKEVHGDEQTLFIPQSMTHEWGHFIVEFEKYNFEKKEQLCHILFLIQEEEPQTEDLATKIKLMKRVLDRVFPDIEKNIKKEYIRFDEEMFLSGIKDEMIVQMGFDYPTLKFLGQIAPMTSELTQEKFLARALLS
jgi:hypothetical protein